MTDSVPNLTPNVQDRIKAITITRSFDSDLTSFLEVYKIDLFTLA